jgi:hypothetical protein
VQIVDHALDFKSFFHKLFSSPAQALTQGGILRESDQSLRQSGPVAGTQ